MRVYVIDRQGLFSLYQRDYLRSLVSRVMNEVGELSSWTGKFYVFLEGVPRDFYRGEADLESGAIYLKLPPPPWEEDRLVWLIKHEVARAMGLEHREMTSKVRYFDDA